MKKMPLQGKKLRCVEMTFPLWFLKDLPSVDSNMVYTSQLNEEKCVMEVKKKESLSQLTDDCSVTIIFQFPTKEHGGGKSRITKWYFSNISNGTNEDLMNFMNGQKEKGENLKIDENMPSSFPSRKRGRPRNSTKKIPPATNDLLNDSSGRYSLRGVKLSSKIMKLEMDSDDENLDPDSASDSESETKSENNTSVKIAKDPCFKQNQNEFTSLEGNSEDKHLSSNKTVSEEKQSEHTKPMTSENGISADIIESQKEEETDGDQEIDSDQPMSESEISCVLCQDKPIFQTRKELRAHEKTTHSDLNCLWCENNDKTYKHIQSLKCHVLTMHGENSTLRTNMCHLCPSRFKFASTLKQHIEEIHEGILRFKCDICQKLFYSNSQLKRHQKIHGDKELKRKCDVCDKGFWHESNLQRHKRTVHSSHAEYFHCSYCGRSFNQKAGMISHIQRMHLNLSAFNCELCSSSFDKSKDLENHMIQIHNQFDFKVKEQRPRYKYNRSQENMLQCSDCSKQFCYKAEMIEHIYTIHADTFPFQCIRCNQGFLRQAYLNRHRKMAHQDILTEEEELSLNMTEESFIIDGKGEGLNEVVECVEAVEEGTDVDYIPNGDRADQITFITEDEEYVTVVNSSENQTEESTLEGNENVTYVTNFNYENVEEVSTSDVKLLDNTREIVTSGSEPMMIQVEGEGQTIQYLIQPAADGQTQTFGADEITKLLMAAKHVSDNPNSEITSESEVKIDNAAEIEIQTMDV